MDLLVDLASKITRERFLKLFTAVFLFFVSSLFAQDTTRSEAFKDNFPRKYPIIKAKYPSYSLIAAYLLVSEANRNDPYAQHELGLRYLLGNGFPTDTVKAIYWIRKAVDQNLPAAQFNYGIMLYNGIGVPWNPFEAYQNFNNAASSGLPEAQFAVGLLYTDNLALNRDYNKAYKLFKLSADANYQPAKDALKQLLKSGFLPSDDYSSKQHKVVRVDESAQLINPNWDLDFYDFNSLSDEKKTDETLQNILNKRSEELKNFFGLSELKDESIPKDTSGIGLLKFAAESGSPEALLLTAIGFEKGSLFKKDLVLAASHYLRAYRLGSFKAGEYLFKLVQSDNFLNILKERVNNNDADAMYCWAGITALGFSSRIANEQALDLLKKAVDKKHIPSIIELGLLYSNGTLVEKSREKAVQYWDIAKELGSKEALVRIAMSNLLDTLLVSDKTEDLHTLKEIADEGSVLAQTALGYCYEKGVGVKENKGLAVRLYRSASQRGNQTAFNSLKRMYDEIRPSEDEFQIFEEN